MSCSRPRIIADAGTILAFDDLDKKCAAHFLSRQVAQKGKQRCLRLLSRCEGRRGKPLLEQGRLNRSTSAGLSGNRDEGDDADVLRIKAEGWTVLADAQVRKKKKKKKKKKSINLLDTYVYSISVELLLSVLLVPLILSQLLSIIFKY